MAHTSPHIHHINTPLWIRSHLPTRRPSIALTLILRVLKYPLSLVYELCKGSKFPYPRNPAIRIDNVNPAGVYFFTHTLTTYRHVHIMHLDNLQAEMWRGCRPRPYKPHKSLVQVYHLFEFHPQGVPAEVSSTAPNDVCRVPKPTTTGGSMLGTPCHCA